MLKQIKIMGEPILGRGDNGVEILQIPVKFTDGSSIEWALPVADIGRMIDFLVDVTKHIAESDAHDAAEAEPDEVAETYRAILEATKLSGLPN